MGVAGVIGSRICIANQSVNAIPGTFCFRLDLQRIVVSPAEVIDAVDVGERKIWKGERHECSARPATQGVTCYCRRATRARRGRVYIDIVPEVENVRAARTG